MSLLLAIAFNGFGVTYISTFYEAKENAAIFSNIERIVVVYLF